VRLTHFKIDDGEFKNNLVAKKKKRGKLKQKVVKENSDLNQEKEGKSF